MKKIWIILFILLPPAAVFIGLFAGRYELGLTEVTGALMEFVRSGVMSIAGGEGAAGVSADSGVSAECYAVVTELRLPRLIAAAFVGAALSASGAAYQGFSQSAGESRTSWSQRRSGIRCGAGDSSLRRRIGVLFFRFCFRRRRSASELLDCRYLQIGSRDHAGTGRNDRDLGV